MDQVGDGGARRVVGLVALGERVPVLALEFGAALLAQLGGERLLEAVGPGAGGLDEAGLDAVGVGVRQVRQLGVEAGTRTTKCSRERIDSVFQAVKSTLLPPSSSLRMSISRRRTPVV